MTVTHQNDRDNACSSDLASSACTDHIPGTSIAANLRATLETECQSTINAPSDSCSLVPTLYREHQEQESKADGSIRIVEENSCSQGLAHTQVTGTTNVSAPQSEP